MKPEARERSLYVWGLVVAPTIWAAHFLLSYITAAVWCAKYAAPDEPLTPIRWAIAVYTLLALTGVAWVGWSGFKRHRFEGATRPHDGDSPEDRHRFLGFATLLLAGLSAVAIVFAALAAVFVRSCR